MSEPCAIENCKRASRTLCHCCNQNLCRDHFNEHDDLLNSQLNPLADEINALGDRLSSINLDKITNKSQKKLDQWRIDCHKIIDRFYEQKCQELHQYITESINQQRIEIADLRSKMTKLIDKQETTNNDIESLTLAIRNLEQNMNEIEQIRIQVDIRPLMIDEHLIQIGKPKVHRFDLLSLPPPYRKIDRSIQSHRALAGNDRFLLTLIDSNLCLIDSSLSIIKQKKCDHSEVGDMCWSSILNCFFVTTPNDVCSFDGNTMSIERVQQTENECWLSCGCSDKSLYLSRSAHDSSVLEFSLLPLIRFVKLWKTSDKSKQEQRVDAIVYNHGTLVLAINDKSIKAKLIELRSSNTFSPLWSLQLDVTYNNNVVRCCLLSHNDLLVADWSTSRIFHITNEGKINAALTWKTVPYNMSVFASNILAMLTDDFINFHKL